MSIIKRPSTLELTVTNRRRVAAAAVDPQSLPMTGLTSHLAPIVGTSAVYLGSLAVGLSLRGYRQWTLTRSLERLLCLALF